MRIDKQKLKNYLFEHIANLIKTTIYKREELHL